MSAHEVEKPGALGSEEESPGGETEEGVTGDTGAEASEDSTADDASDDEDAAEAEALPTQREAIDAALEELRRLPTLKRYRVIAAAGFVVLFLGMMLLRGLHENHLKPVLPYVTWYFDGLGLARTWGMFANPSSELPVFVYGTDLDGSETRLSPPEEDSLWIRIVDQRMRKVRSHMTNKDQRGRWGADLSQYFCHASADAGRKLRFVRIAEINRMGESEGKTLLQTGCKK